MWLAIVSLAANPVLALPFEPDRPVAGLLSDLTAERIDQMCSADGGLAGPFREDDLEGEIDAEIVDDTSWSAPTWKLTPAAGPFVQFERWSNGNEDGTVTLRYQGFTSPQFDQDKLAGRLLQITKESSWTTPHKLTNHKLSGYMARRYFFKWVEIDEKPVRLWLHADGGIETTSLYCFREDLRRPAFIELQEDAGSKSTSDQ